MKKKKNKKDYLAFVIIIVTLCYCIGVFGPTFLNQIVWANETKKNSEAMNEKVINYEELSFVHNENDKYHLLTTSDKLVYDDIIDVSLKILNGKEYDKNRFFAFNKNTVDFHNVYHALEADCDWLIWWAVELQWNIKDYGDEGFAISLASPYDDEDGQIRADVLEKVFESLKTARKFAKSVEEKSVKTQLMLFSSYIAQSTKYNWYTPKHYFDDSEYVLDSKNFISVFDEDDESTSICTGYPSAMQLLCYLNKIPCYRVYGYVNTEASDHAWNKVIVNEQEYLFDITFADKGNIIDDSYVLIPIDSGEYKAGEDNYTEIINVLAG